MRTPMSATGIYEGERIYLQPKDMVPLYPASRKTAPNIIGDDDILTVMPDNKHKNKFILVSGYDRVCAAYFNGESLLFEAKIVAPSSSAMLEEILEAKEKLEKKGYKDMRDVLKNLPTPVKKR